MKRKITKIFPMKVMAFRFALITILCAVLNLHVSAQGQTQTKVTGTVKDANDVAIPGVAIRIKNQTGGVVTDGEGKYTISAPKGAILVFSLIGFTTIEKPVSTAIINVVMTESLSSLNEVVVTGFGGRVKRSDLASAVSSISAKDIEDRQPVDLLTALQGKASGVLVTTDGAPGAEGTIQIRGVTTLNGGAGPLYVVDGVITDNGRNINPLDMASIEVLKDAASASIYGAQAANGVILITTKKGTEGKAKLDVQYTSLFGRLAHKLPQSNSAEVRAFRRMQTPANANAGGNTDSLNVAFNADNDLQDILMGNTGQRQQVNTSLSGASKTFNFYASVNYIDDKSIIVNSYAKSLQSRLNISYQAMPKLKYTANLSLYYQMKNEVPVARTINVIFDRPAFSLIYYPDGTLTSYIGSKRNPLANALYEINKTETHSAQVNNQVDYDITKHIKWTTLFNLAFENPQITVFSPRYLGGPARNVNNGRNEMRKSFRYEAQTYFNYNQIFKDHTVSATLGANAIRRTLNTFRSEYQNTVSEELLVTLPAYIIAANTFTNGTANTNQAIFARVNYDYKSRYIASAVYRNDGSSRFGVDNKRGSFYSGSLAWRFSAESFMTWSNKFLDDAKLRASYGRVGNDQIDDYGSITKVLFGESYNGVGGAAYSTTLGNNLIKWETGVQKNLGIDLTFLKGRLSFTAEVYEKESKDLLYPQQLVRETGFTNVIVNVGTIANKGLELSVSGTPIAKKNFSWGIDANIYFERGKIKDLAGGAPFIAGNKWYVQQGGRIGDFYGWKNLGVYQWNESNAYNDNWDKLTVVLGADNKPLYVGGKPQYTFNGQPYSGNVHNMYDPGGKLIGGDTEWANIQRDSLIDDGDRHVIGNAQPKFNVGFGNNFTYKRFAFNILFNASVGGQIYNTLQYNANYPSATGPGHPDVLYNSWQNQGDIAKYPYYATRNSRGSLKQHGNSAYLEDATFIRLASTRLAYGLDREIAKKLHLRGVSAFIYGTNLLTWTNYRGYDPEFSTSNPLTPGDDTGKYPRRRELGLGLNISL
ncbi:SusC/RagA family TonB-linked outer membrane protein [Pedobacter insulae]|uniref:TonB-linked outer membrane protein, SusC/RagA family n=1 Tax=Pedobacter insulae TaxID=414048 RepID=A0A1I2V281_9SPHI|nr:TonB-dependent receptor [Pedobacter insulae]SFG81346.1 TonB-linked outer membrane protein, SusC/RagA family [Pedobacter insulae]